jgi:hypothetical protein
MSKRISPPVRLPASPSDAARSLRRSSRDERNDSALVGCTWVRRKTRRRGSSAVRGGSSQQPSRRA